MWKAPSQMSSPGEALASLVFTCVDNPCSAIEQKAIYIFEFLHLFLIVVLMKCLLMLTLNMPWVENFTFMPWGGEVDPPP